MRIGTLSLLRTLVATAAIVGATSIIVGSSAWASDTDPALANYPARPVHLVDGFPAGGSTDALARFIANELSTDWNANILVENRSGASGQIGAGHVARSAPDGHTFFVAPNPDILIVAPLLYKSLPYDVDNDFTPAAMIAHVPLVMTVNASSPAKSVKELIELAKAKPGTLTYGSAGQGTIHHLSGAMFTSLAGVNMLHVPYKGTAPAVQDLLGGHVDIVFSPITAVLPHIKAGKLRALAVAGPKRVAGLPDVPTVAEAGVPGYESTLWVSLIAPKNTPEAILEKWNNEVARVMQSDAAQQLFVPQGIEPATEPLAQVKERMARDRERWKKVIEDANITID